MKMIPLTKGYSAVVDDEDYQHLSLTKWRSNIHDGKIYAICNVRRGGKYTAEYMHRIITCAPFGKVVDHINGDTLDNRKENLRVCSDSQNSQNRRQVRSNSGFKGVSFYRNYGNWEANIQVNKKKIKLGYFSDKYEAALAYDRAAREYFGEFACTNADLGLLGATK